MLQQVTVFKVVYANIAVLEDSGEEIVYFPRNIKYVTNTANTCIHYLIVALCIMTQHIIK